MLVLLGSLTQSTCGRTQQWSPLSPETSLRESGVLILDGDVAGTGDCQQPHFEDLRLFLSLLFPVPRETQDGGLGPVCSPHSYDWGPGAAGPRLRLLLSGTGARHDGRPEATEKNGRPFPD